MIEAYAEYGALGIIVLLFVGMIQFLKSQLVSKLKEIEDINIKLIDRWNKETTKADRRHESVIENAERRHEKLTFELRTQSEVLNFLKGKLDKT